MKYIDKLKKNFLKKKVFEHITHYNFEVNR